MSEEVIIPTEVTAPVAEVTAETTAVAEEATPVAETVAAPEVAVEAAI